MKKMSRIDRIENARRAATARWIREDDRASATLPARQAFLRSFERQVDPRRVLPPAVRAARARDALCEHMRTLRARR